MAMTKLERKDILAGTQFCILFKAGLRRTHKVLDFGCGRLTAGKLLIPFLARGNYYALDSNREEVEKGVRELGNIVKKKEPTFSYSGDCNMEIFGVEFDFILAQSVFTHFPLDWIRKSLESASRVMNSNSLFFATYGEGEGDDLCTEWKKTLASYKKTTFRALVKDAGLRCRHLQEHHPGGQRWVEIRK